MIDKTRQTIDDQKATIKNVNMMIIDLKAMIEELTERITKLEK